MQVAMLAPGLWHWRASADADTSVYFEAPTRVVLIDPRLPAEGSADAERFGRHLAADLERVGLPLAVLATDAGHEDCVAVVDRFGGTLLSMEGTSGSEQALPGVIVVFVDSGQRLISLGAPGALAVGRTLVMAPDGAAFAVRVGSPDGLARRQLAINELERLDVDLVIPHAGEPVPTTSADLVAALRADLIPSPPP